VFRLRIGIVSWTATYWPYYVGLSQGLFQAGGVDVELVTLGTTAAGVPALAEQRVDIAATCPDAVVEAATAGAPLRVAGGLVDRPVSSVVAQPAITTWADLRGRRVAVTDLRGSVSIVLRAALRVHGLEPDAYRQVVIGTTPAQAAALERDDVDAAMLTHPFEAPLLARGFRRLGRVADEVGACAFTTLNVRAGWTAEPAWTALVDGLERVDRVFDDPHRKAGVLASLAGATGLPTSSLEEAWTVYVRAGGVLARGGRLDLAGFRRLLDFMRADGLRVAAPGEEGRYLDAAARVNA
jgi:ABC-type nitrate/sulfonate/bicarbonate transport system substrate-binding protein